MVKLNNSEFTFSLSVQMYLLFRFVVKLIAEMAATSITFAVVLLAVLH